MALKGFVVKITSNDDERKNIRAMIAKDSFLILHGTLIAIPMIQAFLISFGVTEVQLGIANTAINAFMLFSIVIFMGRIDSIVSEKLVGTNRISASLLAFFPMAMIVFSITGDRISTLALFTGVVIVWCIQGFFSMARFMIDTKVCQNIFRSNIYGYVHGLDGVIFNAFGVMAGFLIRPVLARSFGFINGFGVAFIGSLLMVPGIMYFSGRFRLLRETSVINTNEIKMPLAYFAVALRKKDLRNATFLHSMRGLVNGISVFILPIGVKYYGIPLSYAEYMVMIASFSGIIGYLFVALYYDRFGSFRSISIGSLFIIIAASGFIMTRHPTMFLLFAALFSIGLAIVGISAPLGVFKITPTDFIGTFTGIRTFVMQISEAIMTLSLGLLLASVSLSYIFIFVTGIVLLQVFFSRNAFGKENQNDA